MLKKYDINANDEFSFESYPAIVYELEKLNAVVKNLPRKHNHDIIISFLKDHKIRNAWIGANPILVKLITSSGNSTSNIESLFEACKKHKLFLSGFENYIQTAIEG